VPKGLDPGFTAFQRRFSSFQRQRLEAISELSELKNVEQIALITQKKGAGLCYEVPCVSKSVQWFSSEAAAILLDSEPDLELIKDIRNLPTLSREIPLVQGDSIRTFTTRSLRSFRAALRDSKQARRLVYDKDPTDWNKVLLRRPLSQMP